jgi:hypothetical protein
MQRNRIAIALVILLGGLTFWFILNNSNSTLKKNLRNFALEDTTQVTRIFLADKNNHTITLDKIHPGLWKLNARFFARNDAVNLLLKTMKTMDVRSPVPKNTRDYVLRSLASDGIKVEVYQGEQMVKKLYVGTETQDLMGTYMLLADPKTGQNAAYPYDIYIPGFDGYLTTRFFTKENEWRDRSIYKYLPPEIKSIRVEYPSKPANGFQINNLPGTRFEVLSLSEGAPLRNIDTMSVMQYVSYFQNIQYEAIEDLSKAFKDSVLHSVPICTMGVTDLKGNSNEIKIYYRPGGTNSIDEKGHHSRYDPDRIFASLGNGGDFVTIQYFVFGKLLQPLAYFRSIDIVKR